MLIPIIIAIFTILIYSNFLYEDNTDDSNLIVLSSDKIQMREFVLEELKEYKMVKRIKPNNENQGLVIKRQDFQQLSNYQKYVTPNNQDVQDYINQNNIATIQDAYNSAVDWVYVSDSYLHEVSEKWLYPYQFISETPSYVNNPVPGTMVSDCESHAYTLVSLIEAIGISKQNVRVVIGYVNFSGETSGHAWVQVYLDNEWVELEATSGPYWDESEEKLVSLNGIPFNYFKNHPYPVEEYWAFFNDIYYYNPDGASSINLPVHWRTTGKLLSWR